MNRLLTVIFLLAIGIVSGLLVGRYWQPGANMATAPDGKREILYWVAPMDPAYRRDKPGKSPMGMDLVPVYADDANEDEPGLVEIDPAIVNSLGVRTARVERGRLPRVLDTVGYVGYDEDTMEQVSTRVDGWVEKLAVKASGESVQRGQVLFELYAPTLVSAQEEYLATLRGANAVLRRASRDRLLALGLTSTQIKQLETERKVRQRTRVYADRDGVVAHLGVREGSYITPATPVMTIADLDRVWVLAEVFARQAPWIEAGQPATIKLDSQPGQQWQGQVDYIYPELDPRTRTLKVRLRFDNPDRAMRPNMFARVTISSLDTDPVLHIPREALIRGGRSDRVVLALGEGRYRSRSVEAGFESGQRVEIRAGRSAGERIVTSGQFLIDSESNIDTALRRLEDPVAIAIPTRVSVAAVVEGYRIGQRRITLRHDAIPEWSWPSMSMGFDVANPVALESLRLGQSVRIEIEKRSDNEYIVTAIETVAVAPEATP